MNGKREGKGKEYNSNGFLKFEGEYLNDKRWNGKYIEYDFGDCQILNEGEYLSGKKNGKGKEYDFDGKLVFEGEYLNGERNGKGKIYIYYPNTATLLKIIEVEYLNGKML